MGRKTTVLGFSVSPELALEYEKLAERSRTSKSELFRQMVRSYKSELEEQEFFRIQRRMARRARKAGALTERDVERIVFENR